MKSVFIMTVAGPETPGVINELAHITHELGGKWTRSKIMKMDGLFSAIIKVSVDEGSVAELKAEQEKTFPSLQFTYTESSGSTVARVKKIALEIDCKDQAGLIKDINSLMLNLDLKVVHMESHRFEVAEIGRTVFSAKLDLEVPEATTAENVAEEIETLGENMRVHVL